MHNLQSEHAGIVVCTSDSDFENQAIRIHEAVSGQEDLKGKFIRVNQLSR